MSEEYIQRIGDAFLKHCQRGLMLSPRDRMIIERWQRAGIPLDVVLAGLNEAFSRPPRRRVTSIAFANPAVERAQSSWKTRQTGEQSRTHDTETEHLSAFGKLDDALRKAAERQSDQRIKACIFALIKKVSTVNEMRLDDENLDVVQRLEDLEDQFCEAVFCLLDHEISQAMRIDIESSLSSMTWSSPKARQVSQRAYLRRRIRQHLGTPVLQLSAGQGWV